MTQRIFKTKKRIKLGIWGLGRGMSFYKTCALLNIDVVAGCDYNEHMRDNFLKQNPGAFVTDNEDEFLAQEFDAVLVATYCPNHADDAIKCLRTGKHVLSEVTAFHTMAEGVRLVEEVEKSGLVYNLAENYPFSEANMYLADQWQKGLFGDLMYAEFEYVHECRSLQFTYIDDVPVIPGNTVHNWRSWINFHYYNTHSLGPVMYITGTRPTRITALPGKTLMAGYSLKSQVMNNQYGMSASLISMSNGGIMRNLMGESPNDTHLQRIWGTLGAAESTGDKLMFRLGGAGQAPKMEVTPEWPMLSEHAKATGHGGGDFWIMYFFAREILYGKPAPFDIYSSCDVTIPGILAVMSTIENGKPYDIPDFRNKKEREQYRNHHFAQKRYDVEKGCFPKKADPKLTHQFSSIMKNLINRSQIVRAFVDWEKVFDSVKEKHKVVDLASAVIDNYDAIKTTYKAARKLADAYPKSDGAKLINEMLEFGLENEVNNKNFLGNIKKCRTSLKRKSKK